MDRHALFHRMAAGLSPRFQQYVATRGALGQVVSFMAVVADIKPVLDDWIPVERLDQFLLMIADFGLVYEIDSFFEFLEDAAETKKIVSGERLNTTRARGSIPDKSKPIGAAHIFLAREPEQLKSAVASGWYPLISDGRVVDKPWIDHYHFGRWLGYPECCRRFFAFHNNWIRDNSYYQAYRATSRPSFLCNTLFKHSGLSYAVHLPCSFSCQATADLASQVRAFVSEDSPAFAKHIDRLLQYPCLVLSEWEMYALVGGFVGGERVHYRDVLLLPTNQPDVNLYRALIAGDELEVEGNVIRIYCGTKVISTYFASSDRFCPQVPVLINFACEREL